MCVFYFFVAINRRQLIVGSVDSVSLVIPRCGLCVCVDYTPCKQLDFKESLVSSFFVCVHVNFSVRATCVRVRASMHACVCTCPHITIR